ncbi:MAG: hypothetical protein Q8L86_10205 [Vicinamibacterales bacterium]|nr:hypothetical protein [Vicinamibacterales bacterium]
MTFKFAMGVKVRDRVTGFTGVVISRCQHLTGCDTYGVQAPVKDGDGETKSPQWFDDQRLELVDGKPLRLDNSRANWAGPNPQPSRAVPA